MAYLCALFISQQRKYPKHGQNILDGGFLSLILCFSIVYRWKDPEVGDLQPAGGEVCFGDEDLQPGVDSSWREGHSINPGEEASWREEAEGRLPTQIRVRAQVQEGAGKVTSSICLLAYMRVFGLSFFRR